MGDQRERNRIRVQVLLQTTGDVFERHLPPFGERVTRALHRGVDLRTAGERLAEIVYLPLGAATLAPKNPGLGVPSGRPIQTPTV